MTTVGQPLDDAAAWILYGPARDRTFRKNLVALSSAYAALMKDVGLREPKFGMAGIRESVLQTWKEYNAFKNRMGDVPVGEVSNLDVQKYQMFLRGYRKSRAHVANALAATNHGAPSAPAASHVALTLPAPNGLADVTGTLNTTLKVLLFGGAGILLYQLYSATKTRR